MPEGMDDAANAFANEIAPPSQPLDQAGKAIETRGPPEEMFAFRPVEGSEDGGDDAVRRDRERQVTRADQRVDNSVHRAKSESPGRIGARELEPDDDAPLVDDELQQPSPKAVPPKSLKGGLREDDDEKYEVIVDGQPHEVTLGEALSGYVRQETFHRRLAELNNLRGALEEDHNRQQQNWTLLMQAKEAYENDVRTMMPPEPDWDREFAINPQQAHANQKTYQALYAKLTQSRQERQQMAAIHADEADRRLKKYAVDGFSRFVFDAKIPDEPTLKKEIQSMRKTAFSAGFSEQEVATVYDPRMLSVLRKASKYDRMMAASRPRAEVPGKGRTLTPGAATPLGNAPRKGLDDAQRRLASSGRLDDAADVFRRLL